MSRPLRITLVVLLALVTGATGAGVSWYLQQRRAGVLPEGPVVIERMREVARLETLEVSLYEIVHFQPDAKVRDSLMGTALEWAKYELFPEEGKAIVFATARIGLDLSRLDREHVRVQGDQVEVVLPPLQTTVELRPDETLVVDSNLDSQQTMQLLDVAKRRFEAKLNKDSRLQEKARVSSERSLRALLITLGYPKVRFVETLPPLMHPG